MNRRQFLKSTGSAGLLALLVPTVLLAKVAQNTREGLLAWIQRTGNVVEYTPLTIEDFDEMVRILNEQRSRDYQIYYAKQLYQRWTEEHS